MDLWIQWGKERGDEWSMSAPTYIRLSGVRRLVRSCCKIQGHSLAFYNDLEGRGRERERDWGRGDVCNYGWFGNVVWQKPTQRCKLKRKSTNHKIKKERSCLWAVMKPQFQARETTASDKAQATFDLGLVFASLQGCRLKSKNERLEPLCLKLDWIYFVFLYSQVVQNDSCITVTHLKVTQYFLAKKGGKMLSALASLMEPCFYMGMSSSVPRQ